MEATLQKWGNSFAIRIPKNLTQNCQFKEGQKLILNQTENGFMVEPKAYCLDELISQYKADSDHDFIETSVLGSETIYDDYL